jgi:membrane protease YdiL (CAAX protease family)
MARFHPWRVAVVLALLMVAAAAGTAAGGELGRFMLAGLEVLPLTALAVLAYLGVDRPWARAIALFCWLAVGVAAVALGFLASFDALAPPEAGLGPSAPPLDSRDSDRLQTIAWASLLALPLSAFAFLRRIRRALARVLPVDPDSFVHTVALATVLVLTLTSLAPLLFLGVPPLLSSPAVQAGGEALAEGRDAAGMLRDDLYVLVWTIPATLLAVGFGIRRGLGEALGRLGMVRPTRRQAAAGLALGAAALLAAHLVDQRVQELWSAMDWPRTDEEAVSRLFAYTLSPMGAVVIGVSAGLGEELSIRGVLQPRLGIWLSNLFFTSLHALQYHWDGLLLVFLVGLVAGLIRQRANTTTSALFHGSYNCLITMAELLEIPGFS